MNEKNINSMKYDLQFIKDNNLILFEAISGSYAYGTNIETSDKDTRGVFIMREEDYFGLDYIEQVNDEKNDIVFYEIGRFLELLKSNNPNILELLNIPPDCIIYQHPIFDLILEHKEKFITKICKNSFGAYAKEQIRKATGMDKMMNWEKEKVTRKDPLDFCNVIKGHGTMPLKKWLKSQKMEQKFCGIVNIPNARDMHALYYDERSHNCFFEGFNESSRDDFKKDYLEKDGFIGLGYKGIQKEDEKGNILSNEIRLSSIPKNEELQCVFSYNKDGYISHCRDFHNYQTWLKKRNKQRWVDVEGHGQQLDGKNLLHCLRLIEMAVEIAEGKGIVVRRPNAQELLDIRRGKVDLKSLIAIAEQKISKMDKLFEKNSLPESVDKEMVNQLLIKIRKIVYGRN